jgi:hypothetical protein
VLRYSINTQLCRVESNSFQEMTNLVGAHETTDFFWSSLSLSVSSCVRSRTCSLSLFLATECLLCTQSINVRCDVNIFTLGWARGQFTALVPHASSSGEQLHARANMALTYFYAMKCKRISFVQHGYSPHYYNIDLYDFMLYIYRADPSTYIRRVRKRASP